MRLFIFLLSLSFQTAAHSDYFECILENMKGVGSDIAAEEIKVACSNKYGEADDPTVPDSEPLDLGVPDPDVLDVEVSKPAISAIEVSDRTGVSKEFPDLEESEHQDEATVVSVDAEGEEESQPAPISPVPRINLADQDEVIEGSLLTYAGFTEEDIETAKEKLFEEMSALRKDELVDLSLISSSSLIEIDMIKNDLEEQDITTFVSRSQKLVQSLVIRNAAETEFVIEEVTYLVLNTEALSKEDKIKFLEGYLKYYLGSMPRFSFQQRNRQQLAEKKRNAERVFKKYLNLSLQLYLLAIEIEPVPVGTLGMLLRYMSVSYSGSARISATKIFYEEAMRLTEKYDIPPHLISEIYLDYADLLVQKWIPRRKEISEAYQRYFRSLGAVENDFLKSEMLHPYVELSPSDPQKEEVDEDMLRISFEITTRGKVNTVKVEGIITRAEELEVKGFFKRGRYRPSLLSGVPTKSKVSFNIKKSELKNIVNPSTFMTGRHPFLIKGVKSIPLPQVTSYKTSLTSYPVTASPKVQSFPLTQQHTRQSKTRYSAILVS